MCQWRDGTFFDGKGGKDDDGYVTRMRKEAVERERTKLKKGWAVNVSSGAVYAAAAVVVTFVVVVVFVPRDSSSGSTGTKKVEKRNIFRPPAGAENFVPSNVLLQFDLSNGHAVSSLNILHCY